jgi:hypothetical protein
MHELRLARTSMKPLTYLTNLLCPNPQQRTWGNAKTCLRYLKRTPNIGITFGGEELILHGFNDANRPPIPVDAVQPAVASSSFVEEMLAHALAFNHLSHFLPLEQSTKLSALLC